MDNNLEDARMQGTPAELGHPPEDAFMVPGMGLQGVPFAAANDNERYVWVNGNRVPADLVETTFAPLDQLAPATVPEFAEVPAWFDLGLAGLDKSSQPATHDGTGYLPRLGDFICMYNGGKFYPHDPRADEVDIRNIAHSLGMQCRYGGHAKRFFSVGEHSTLMARWLRGQYGAEIALIGLLHDAPEALTGFGDVQRPVKPYWVTEIEQRIYEGAVAPHFGLPRRIPKEVHDADRRITSDELVNLVPMDWHKEYNDPLGVPIMYWSPREAEEEFLATFDALRAQVVGMRKEAA